MTDPDRTTHATHPRAYHPGILTFDAVSVFARYPVAALDLVEVAPNSDPAETTTRLAAQALFQFPVERAPAGGGR